MNETIDGQWKGKAFKDYLKSYQELEEKISDLGKVLENGDEILTKYQAIKNPLDEFRNLEGVRVENAKNVQPLVKPKGDPWKEIRESGVGVIHEF